MRKESAVSDRLKFPYGRDGAVPGVQQAKRLFVGVVAFEAADAAVEHKANDAAAFKDGAKLFQAGASKPLRIGVVRVQLFCAAPAQVARQRPWRRVGDGNEGESSFRRAFSHQAFAKFFSIIWSVPYCSRSIQWRRVRTGRGTFGFRWSLAP
jgi:hypothetical protein